MGAQQSTTNANNASPPVPAAEAKTSYYELLSVPRTATDDEIKKAYRRKALELHPDRNYGDVERTTRLFADISTAYEVLADPQERAWYDAHEGEILRGGDGGAEGERFENGARVTTAEDISRMMGRFRKDVEFSDAPTGFYGFVRETFEALAAEEERAGRYEGVRVPDYPSFGHRDDGYEDVVREFYGGWSGFATVKTFASLDKYRLADAPDRRIRRLMEKENRKLREEGIKQFNAAVQTLVAFVRKRDPRYTPNSMTAEDQVRAQREARQQQAARARAANAAKISEEADAVPDWAKAREPDELEEEEEEEIEEEHFECVACRKTFKSERQWEAHEKSKKHQKAIYALKKKMRKDDAALNLDEEVLSSGVMTPVEDDEGLNEDAGSPVEAEEETASEDHDSTTEQLGDRLKHVELEDEHTDEDTSGPRSKPHPQLPTTSDSQDSPATSEDDDEYASRSDIEARLASYAIPSTSSPSTASTPLSTDPSDPQPAPAAKKLGAAALKRAKKAAKQAEADAQADASKQPHKCARCKKGFASKTKLFEHLKAEGHAAAVGEVKGAGGAKKGRRK